MELCQIGVARWRSVSAGSVAQDQSVTLLRPSARCSEMPGTQVTAAVQCDEQAQGTTQGIAYTIKRPMQINAVFSFDVPLSVAASLSQTQTISRDGHVKQRWIVINEVNRRFVIERHGNVFNK